MKLILDRIYRIFLGVFLLANISSIVLLLAPASSEKQGLWEGLKGFVGTLTAFVFPAALDGVLFFTLMIARLRPEWAALVLLALAAPIGFLMVLGLKHGGRTKTAIIALFVVLSVSSHFFSVRTFRPLLEGFLTVGEAAQTKPQAP